MKRLKQFGYGSVCSIALMAFAMHSSVATAQTSTEGPAGSQLVAQQNEAELNAQTESSKTLKIGTKEILPFVFLDEPMPYGYSIEVWNEIARASGLKTEWVKYDSVQSMLDGLSAGEIDAAMAGISITAEREAAGIDFSYPFYRSGLQIMVPSSSNSRWQSALLGLFSWSVWKPLLLVIATSAGFALLIWSLEHKHNDSFSSDPIRGIGQGMWFAIVTLGTFGYGDVIPTRLPGRIIACLWMGASFFVVADFIASLTVDQLAENNMTFEDLVGEKVGVVDSTTAESYVRAKPVELVEFANFDDMVAALESGELAAVVHDYPTLKYVSSRAPDTFELTGRPLTQEDYGVAFRDEAQLTEPVSREILTLQEEGRLQLIREKWFGADQDSL
ncbi:MAG: transporter substrate-binding domain-containing protein [Cyanobacteria bacterium P01_C01_bin.69]